MGDLALTNVQAQTVANFYLAFDLELSIVPVLNKIDLPAAEPEKVAEQVQQVGEALGVQYMSRHKMQCMYGHTRKQPMLRSDLVLQEGNPEP